MTFVICEPGLTRTVGQQGGGSWGGGGFSQRKWEDERVCVGERLPPEPEDGVPFQGAPADALSLGTHPRPAAGEGPRPPRPSHLGLETVQGREGLGWAAGLATAASEHRNGGQIQTCYTAFLKAAYEKVT